MSAPVMSAKGTISTLAPMEPNSRTCGITPALRKVRRR